LRIETNGLQRIKDLCGSFKLDENEVYEKARLVISVYHEIVWGSIKNEDPRMAGPLEKDYEAALLYLSGFPPTEGKREFLTKLLTLFHSEWFSGLIGNAVNEVSLFPHNGEFYAEILNKLYFSEHNVSDKELQPSMPASRSTYFKRKKEAILFLGVTLWGVILPRTIILIRSGTPQRAYMLMIAENKGFSESGRLDCG